MKGTWCVPNAPYPPSFTLLLFVISSPLFPTPHYPFLPAKRRARRRKKIGQNKSEFSRLALKEERKNDRCRGQVSPHPCTTKTSVRPSVRRTSSVRTAAASILLLSPFSILFQGWPRFAADRKKSRIREVPKNSRRKQKSPS